MQEKTAVFGNPLATESVQKLILKFAIPAIISFLVSALYNIVDQIFIGQGIGMLGNAATNVAFPLTTITTAAALLLGVGSASNFNLNMGAEKKERAAQIAGNGIFLMMSCGVILAILVIIFLHPLIWAFGATDQVYDYAITYTGITSLGIPFLILSTGGSQLVRADGCPTYSMVCMLSGAVINTILDPLFIFTFQMGISGAALATVLGQVVSGLLVVIHFFRFRSVRLNKYCFRPYRSVIRAITSLGAAACFNQLAMCAVQITMNNTLTYYGGLSNYGSDIPLACVGVISKVNIVFMALHLSSGSLKVVSQSTDSITALDYFIE